jgi:hypothetical protein
MTTKPGAKRISGQPDRLSLIVEQRTDKLQQRLVLWADGPISQESADIRAGYLSTWADVRLVFHYGHLRRRVAR